MERPSCQCLRPVTTRTLLRTDGTPYKVNSRWCRVCLNKRHRAAEILGIREHYESHLSRIPRTCVTIKPEDLKAWERKHDHPEADFGSIGGNMSSYQTHTSIGTYQYHLCTYCREEAFVDDLDQW